MKDQDAVSPVVGTLLVLVMFTVTTATIVAVVRPEIVEYQEAGKVDVIATQMANAVADVRHLAINGNEAEIRQPVISIHDGLFELNKGHTVALTVGYFDNSSADSMATYRDPGFYHSFHVSADPSSGASLFAGVVDGTDSSVGLTFHHPYHLSPQDYAFNYIVSRWDSTEWDTIHSGSSSMSHGATTPAFALDPTGTWTIRDGPIRIAFYNSTTTPPHLDAEVYLYEQTSLSYWMDGESGSRSVHAENGGLMKGHKGRYTLEQGMVVKPPSTGLGNDMFSMRSIRLNETGASSASGGAQIGLVMRLNVTESFVFDNGASHVRMQFWGGHPRAMERQLMAAGFTDDAADGKGVYWAYEKTPDHHWGFPFHFTDSQIDVRMTSR